MIILIQQYKKYTLEEIKMKKIIATILLGGLLLGMTACGSAPKEVTEDSNETVQEEVKETETEEKEEVTEPTPEPTEEPTPEPTEEPKEDFTRDIAMNKVTDLFNARNELFANGKVDTDLNFLVAAENINGGIELTGITTADGVNTDEDARSKWATVANYFYDYVNNNSGYYDLGEYLTSHTFDEIIDKYSSNLRNESVDTDIVIMAEAPGVLPYLLENLDNLSFGDLISGEECTAASVNDIDVYYEMPILINGEKCGVTAVFDEAGNLLNLITVDEDGWTDDNYRDSTDEVLALEN